MKRKLFLLLGAALMSLQAVAYSFYAMNSDGVTIYYSITNSTVKTAAVTCKDGDYNSYSGAVNIPETVTYNGNVYTVTAIDQYAFKNCSSLTTVEIPNSVTVIDKESFYNCSALTTIEIPNSVASIGEYTFYGCSSLATVNIPSSVTSIGNYAFKSCVSLSSLTFADSENEINLGHNESSSSYAIGLFSECPIETLYLGRNLKQ